MATLGLRDRKRQQTRARLERAAVELALRDGLQRATIDAICDEAEVSPRTFFNYFDSKEDALFGLPELAAADDEAREFDLHNGDLVESLVPLLVEVGSPAITNRSLQAPRAELLRQHPELFPQRLARIAQITDRFLPTVRGLMAHDPRFTNLAGAASPLAEMILALCASAVHTAAREWIAAGGDAPLDGITTRAVELTREVIEKLR